MLPPEEFVLPAELRVSLIVLKDRQDSHRIVRDTHRIVREIISLTARVGDGLKVEESG
jgi:hypothetical protein